MAGQHSLSYPLSFYPATLRLEVLYIYLDIQKWLFWKMKSWIFQKIGQYHSLTEGQKGKFYKINFILPPHSKWATKVPPPKDGK